jgi:hypothetical protein
MVKIYDVGTWEVVHSIKYSLPLLSVAVSVRRGIQVAA